MRVLMVNRFFYPFLGGVEFHVRHLGQELVRLGCEVTVAFGRRAAEDGKGRQGAAEGLVLRPLPGPWGLGALIGEGFDVVHAHMPRNAWTLAGLHFARRHGVPSVLTPHCFYPSRDPVRRGLKAAYDATLLRYTFRLAGRVINLTESDRADALARGMAPEQSRVIPNAVRVADLAAAPAGDFRARHGIAGDFLLFVGRFDAVKNVEFLIRAQQRLRELTLVLIGSDGGRLAALRRLVVELGLDEGVRVIERAPFADLCAAYRQASALVLASRYEGLPTVLLEALYFGCPVVASRVGGVPHVLEAPLGHTFAPDDEDGYVAAVQAALARGRDGTGAGRRLVEREYAWAAVAPRVLDVYRELR